MVITICVLMIVTSTTILIGILTTDGGTTVNIKWLRFLRLFTVTTFSAFLLVYIGVLYLLTSRLMLYFPKFYLKERKSIFLTTGIIIFSIFARILNNIMLFFFQHEIDESYDHATWLFPMINLTSSIFASLFPIAAVLISFNYALTHKKRQFTLRSRSKQCKDSTIENP